MSPLSSAHPGLSITVLTSVGAQEQHISLVWATLTTQHCSIKLSINSQYKHHTSPHTFWSGIAHWELGGGGKIEIIFSAREIFLAATAALEVQMLVCVCVCVCVCHTCYNCTGLLQDFWRTSEGLLKDFWGTSEGLYGLQNLLVPRSSRLVSQKTFIIGIFLRNLSCVIKIGLL